MLDQHRTAARGLKYFSRPPWRSYLFLGNTFFLLMVTLFPIEIVVHSRQSPKVIWMFAPVAALVVLWARVWKAHSDVYAAIHSMSAKERTEYADVDARTAVPFDALGSMLYRSFGLAMFAVCLAYAATDDFVRASLHR